MPNEGWGPTDRPWWSHLVDFVSSEPLLALVVVAVAVPVIAAWTLLRMVRGLGGRRRA